MSVAGELGRLDGLGMAEKLLERRERLVRADGVVPPHSRAGETARALCFEAQLLQIQVALDPSPGVVADLAALAQL